jgi:hypothetical protein
MELKILRAAAGGSLKTFSKAHITEENVYLFTNLETPYQRHR